MKLNIQLFASTNKTTNYELPQFVGSDKPTWLGDFNQAMADIDAGMHENASDITAMASDVSTATSTASQASQDVASLTSTVNTLSGNVSTATTTANNAQQTANSALNVANSKLSASDLLDLVYPVGSIYTSTGSTSPSTLFGGTWTQIKDTFLLTAGDTYTAGATGGEATHTLTYDEMPSHNHGVVVGYTGSGNNHFTFSNNNGDGFLATNNAGNGQAHNNMPPYLVVYAWERTA